MMLCYGVLLLAMIYTNSYASLVADDWRQGSCNYTKNSSPCRNLPQSTINYQCCDAYADNPPLYHWTQGVDKVVFSAGQRTSARIQLPFPITFFGAHPLGTTTSSIVACPNGFISFLPNINECSESPITTIPDPTGPTGFIAMFMSELDVRIVTQKTIYLSDRTPIMHVLQYDVCSAPCIDPKTWSANFQLKLFPDNHFEVHYSRIGGAGRKVLFGVESAHGLVGLQYCNEFVQPVAGFRPRQRREDALRPKADPSIGCVPKEETAIVYMPPLPASIPTTSIQTASSMPETRSSGIFLVYITLFIFFVALLVCYVSKASTKFS